MVQRNQFVEVIHLRGFDVEATSFVATQMKSNGIDLQFGVNVVKIEKEKMASMLLIVLSDQYLTRFYLPQVALPIQRNCKLDQLA